MNTALWMSALLMGLVGGPHCLVMCGGACSALAGRCGGRRPRQALLAWQLGRLLAYSAAGAVVASSVVALGEWGRQLAWLRPWWLMLHLAAVALGAWMAWHGRAPSWLAGPLQIQPAAGSARPPVVASQSTLAWSVVDGPRSTAARGGSGGASPAAAAPAGWWRAGIAGLGWVALPCGLLQAALLTAALGSTAVDGAVVMAFFAIGSGASLWLGPSLWIALTRRLPGNRSAAGGWRLLQGFGPVQATRLAGVLLAAGSGWAVWHTVLGPAVDAFCA